MKKVTAPELFVSPLQAFDLAVDGSAEPNQFRNRLKSIFYCWPNLMDVSVRYAGRISHLYPDSRKAGNLLLNTLEQSVDAYVAARSLHRGEFSPPSAYIEKILSSAGVIASFDVYGTRGADSARWNAGKVDLISFVKDFESIVFHPIAPQAREITGTRLVLFGTILTVEDASLLNIEIPSGCTYPHCAKDKEAVITA